MKKVKSVTSKLAYQIATARYHLIHKNEVKKILRNIEEEKGKTDSKLIKLSDEYANDVLGWQGYAPWLYVYSAIAGSFKEGWIPDNYYGRVVVPAMQGPYGKISYLRSLSKRVLNTSLFPDLAYVVNGSWFSKGWEFLQEKDIAQLLFKDFQKIVFKVDNSSQGGGVSIYDKNEFDLKKIKKLGNGVFQYYVRQHPFFNELMPSSVATLRITTVIDKSMTASVRACNLRLGRMADTHISSASQIRIPVHIQSGTLGSHGFLNTWCTVDRHPDTNVLFEKKKIPMFKECVATVLKLHASIPFIGSIGWDLVVDHTENIQIMEWNGYSNDIKFSEASMGPCFSDLGWEKLHLIKPRETIRMYINWRF